MPPVRAPGVADDEALLVLVVADCQYGVAAELLLARLGHLTLARLRHVGTGQVGLRGDLVDEAVLLRSAKTIGPAGIDALEGLRLEALTRSPRLALVSTEGIGEDTIEHFARR